MGWDSKSLKEAFEDIAQGPKASKLGSALGEIAVDESKNSYERLCPHCYDIVEIEKDSPIWGCLSCTKSFVATENIDDLRRVAIAMLSLFGLLAKMAMRDKRVAGLELKKISQKISEFCNDDIEKQFQKKIEKSAKKEKFSLDYFAEVLYSSFEGKKYRNYREILYRALFALVSSDGKIYSYEMGILKEIEKLMKFEYPIYDYLYAELIDSIPPRYAHYILGTTSESSDDEVKDAYETKKELYSNLKLQEELNFPKIFEEFAKRHAQSIENAYNLIREGR
jgi:hypothetical protein